MKKREQDQTEMIKKYRLGYNDRSILLFGGISGSTGIFSRRQYALAVKKLIRIGLLKEVKTKYGFDYLLTDVGWEVNSKIYSNF